MPTKKQLLDYKTCKGEDIMKWCAANNQVDWLKNVATVYTTFFSLRKIFFETFMPEAIPHRKPKKDTLWDKIAAM